MQRLAAEQRARVLIDQQLAQAGWQVQDKRGDLNLFASHGVAVREVVLKSGHGRVDIHEIAETALGKMLDEKRQTGQPTPYLRNINVRWRRFDLSDLRTGSSSIRVTSSCGCFVRS